MSSFWKIDFDKPLSVVIGRIAIRVLFIAFIIWAVMSGYKAYQKHQRAQEIAPIHQYAEEFLTTFKDGEYFQIQERLDPKLQHIVSIDWLAHFAKNAELNATNGGNWGEWSKKDETNSTIYTIDGNISYTTGRHNPMRWEIKSSDHNMSVVSLKIGKRSLKPSISALFR